MMTMFSELASHENQEETLLPLATQPQKPHSIICVAVKALQILEQGSQPIHLC